MLAAHFGQRASPRDRCSKIRCGTLLSPPLRAVHFWQGEKESGPITNSRFHPDAAAVALDDLFADGKPESGAGILMAGVQALENDKDAIKKLGIDPDAIVADVEGPGSILQMGPDLNM